jgi:hypothetical protein
MNFNQLPQLYDITNILSSLSLSDVLNSTNSTNKATNKDNNSETFNTIMKKALEKKLSTLTTEQILPNEDKRTIADVICKISNAINDQKEEPKGDVTTNTNNNNKNSDISDVRIFELKLPVQGQVQTQVQTQATQSLPTVEISTSTLPISSNPNVSNANTQTFHVTQNHEIANQNNQSCKTHRNAKLKRQRSNSDKEDKENQHQQEQQSSKSMLNQSPFFKVIKSSDKECTPIPLQIWKDENNHFYVVKALIPGFTKEECTLNMIPSDRHYHSKKNIWKFILSCSKPNLENKIITSTTTTPLPSAPVPARAQESTTEQNHNNDTNNGISTNSQTNGTSINLEQKSENKSLSSAVSPFIFTPQNYKSIYSGYPSAKKLYQEFELEVNLDSERSTGKLSPINGELVIFIPYSPPVVHLPVSINYIN